MKKCNAKWNAIPICTIKKKNGKPRVSHVCDKENSADRTAAGPVWHHDRKTQHQCKCGAIK